MDRSKGVGLILLLAGLIMVGCETEKPASLYNPNSVYNPDPVITAVEPADSALAGIVTIKIMGQHFSPVKEYNFVYFGKTKAAVLEASETQLLVQSPNFVADSTTIKVAVMGAISFSNQVPYKLVRGVGEYGGFGDFDEPLLVECDRAENVYVALASRKIMKIAPNEQKVEYASATFPLFTGMKFGPDGSLYIARNTRNLYKVPTGGGSVSQWATLKGPIYDLDFSPSGVMYAGGNGDSLFAIQANGTSSGAAVYASTYIKAVRVFNGYVYVGGLDKVANKQMIWRNQILADGKLSPNELYFDWASHFESTSEILSITFAADGVMYVGTNAPEAIIMIHPDKNFAPLYPGVLEPSSNSLSWGSKQFLYVARRSDDAKKRRVIKINMLKEGAPYYGRP